MPFQYSQAVRLDQSISEAWTTDHELDYWSLIDSLGNRSRIAQFVINNPLNIKERRYFIMQRVRFTDAYGATIFVGRIMGVEPHHSNSQLVLTCRDYLGDLADKVIAAADGDGAYTAATRNGLISKLVEEETEEPESGQDIDRSLLPRMLQDSGNYLESLTKTYSLRGQYGLDPETRGPASYNYRGTKTVLEAISEISSEDSQQDLMILKYTNSPVHPESAKVTNYPKKYPTMYWTDHTAGISDGKEYFSTPIHTRDFTSPVGVITAPSSTLAADETNSDTTIAVATGQGSRFQIGDIATITTTNAIDEDVLITNIASDNLTVTRGYSGTTAVSHLRTDRIFVKQPARSSDFDMLYFGSNSKFDGIEYTFRQSGTKIHESNYDELVWQYYNGDTWVTFIPDYDTLFKADERLPGEVRGRATWRSLIEDTTNTVDATTENALAYTTLNGAINTTVTVITLANNSTSNMTVGGILEIDSEVLKIISIDDHHKLTVQRDFGGGSTLASHSDGAVVRGGHRQGMADWIKRDLGESPDMPNYNNWNVNTNQGWRDWRTAYQGDKGGLTNFVAKGDSSRLTFYDEPFPKGKLQRHSLRNGDRLEFSKYAGSFVQKELGNSDLHLTYGMIGHTFGWIGGNTTFSWTGDQPISDPPIARELIIPDGHDNVMVVLMGLATYVTPGPGGANQSSLQYRIDSKGATPTSTGVVHVPVAGTIAGTSYQNNPELGSNMNFWVLKDPTPGTYYFQMSALPTGGGGQQNINPGGEVFLTGGVFSGVDLSAPLTYYQPTSANTTGGTRTVEQVRYHQSGKSLDNTNVNNTALGTNNGWSGNGVKIEYNTSPGDYICHGGLFSGSSTAQDSRPNIEVKYDTNDDLNGTGGSSTNDMGVPYVEWLTRQHTMWRYGSDGSTPFGVNGNSQDNRGYTEVSFGFSQANQTKSTTAVQYDIGANSWTASTTSGGWNRNQAGFVVPSLSGMAANFLNGVHHVEVQDPYSVKLWGGYTPSATEEDSFHTATVDGNMTNNQTFVNVLPNANGFKIGDILTIDDETVMVYHVVLTGSNANTQLYIYRDYPGTSGVGDTHASGALIYNPHTNPHPYDVTETAATNINESSAKVVGATRPEDIDSTSMSTVGEGGGKSTYRYWVRCWVRQAASLTTTSEALDNSETLIDVVNATNFSRGDVVTIDREDMLINIIQTSQLNEDLDSTETAVDVDSGSLFVVGDEITIDSEQMHVTAINSNTLTVSRGYNSTAATTHSDNTPIISNNAKTLSVVRGYNSTGIVTHSTGAAVTSGKPAYLSTVSIATKPNLFRDFRAEDPHFFNEVWKYSRDVSSTLTSALGGSAGDTTIAVTSGAAFETGDVITIDSEDMNVTGYPYTITSITAATPAVITTSAAHGLATGDLVSISGSNSGQTVNGIRTVTVVNSTSFSVPVDNTTGNSGSAGNTGEVLSNSATNNVRVERAFNGTTRVAHDNASIVTASLGNETNHSIPGGTWLSLNTDGGNDTAGSPLMWSALGATTPWLENNTDQVLLGSEEPFNGVELHAVQGYSYPIVAITAASSATITTSVVHGLSTGDYVLITGSNSGVDVDGYHQVTVSSTTAFVIAVNTSSGAAGTAGIVRTGIPDYSNCDLKFEILDSFPKQYWDMPPEGRLAADTTGWRTIQATMDNYDDLSWSGRSNVGVSTLNPRHFPLGAMGPTRWRADNGYPLSEENHWYCEIRFNTDKPRNNVALRNVAENPDRILPPTYPFRQNISNDEYDLAYAMTLNNSWNERVSLLNPYSAYQYDGVHRHDTDLVGYHALNMSYRSLAYVGSTTTMTITFSYAHHCAVGDWIKITGSDASSGTNGWDGVFKVTAITNRRTLVFDRGVTGTSVTATGTVELTRISKPPSTKSLYWLRMRTHQKPNKFAMIRAVKTATNARFKYFDRGKEPWHTNDALAINGSASNSMMGAIYAYNSDATSGVVNMSTITDTNGYTTINTASAHGLSVGDTVELTSTTYRVTDGVHKVVRVIDADSFVVGHAYTSAHASSVGSNDRVQYTRFTDYTVDANTTHSSATTNITHSSTGNPGTITTETGHNLRVGDAIIFAGTSSSPPTNATYRVRSILSGTQFTYEGENGSTVNVTSAVTTGTVTKHLGIASITAANPCKITTHGSHGLLAGARITFVGTAGTTPSINLETLVKEVISDTEFTIYIDTSGGSAGTVNTGYINVASASLLVKPASTNWAANDAVYFGKSTPFNQLRFENLDLLDFFGGSQSSVLSGVWEYYRTDNKGSSSHWAALDVLDTTHGFRGNRLAIEANDASNLHVEWSMPGFGQWKSSMAGVKDTTTANAHQPSGLHLDKRFGTPMYFVRYRITTITNANSHPNNSSLMRATAFRVYCGPNLWSPDLEVGTLSGVSSQRHTATLADFGLTLDDREKSLNDGSYLQAIGYELKDHALDFINSVTVRGRSGSYASVRDEESIKYFRITKEKIIDDPSLTNDTQCRQRALAALEQLKPSIPLNILSISAENPTKITTGGRTKYLTYVDGDNPANIHFFDTKGISIVSNSTEGDNAVDELAAAVANTTDTTITVKNGQYFRVNQLIKIDAEILSISSIEANVLTVVRAAFGSTATTHINGQLIFVPNRTYVTTDADHNLKSGDRILITDVSNTAPRFQGPGAWSGDVGENTAGYNYIHIVNVAGSRELVIQTADAVLSGTGALAHHMSELNETPDPDTTTRYDSSNDAVGGMIHVMAETSLQVGDTVRILGSVTSGANGTKTVSNVANNGSTVRVSGLAAGTTPTDILGYALIAEPHNLSTGDRVLIRNSSSMPSIDGYRRITRTSATTFTVDLDLTSQRAGISGLVRPTSVREATIRVLGFPVYTVGGLPRVLRAGDMVEVSLVNAGIFGETWLVYSVKFGSGETEVTLFRDRDAVAEPGDTEKKLLRDLASRIRETSNAVFQQIDKSVESGLDFIPEGPGRMTTKLEYGPTNDANQLDVPNPGTNAGLHLQTFPDDFRLSFKLYENYSTREFKNEDLLRVDGQGIRPDDSGPATGGGGITFIGRDKNTGVTGATPNYHPGEDEATLYLRKSGTANEGSGLYLAHRGIFNSADTYDEWLTDTPKLQAEVFVGLSGRVTANGSGVATVTLPTLTSNPRIIATTEANGYVQVTNSTTSATLTARDAAGSAIANAVINYIVVYNSSSNVGGLNEHY